jgi:hypothetical protein
LPEGTGYYGEPQHDKLVQELVDIYDHWRKQLSPRFQEMVSDTRLYLGYREDRRQAHEKWRSWSWLGDPFQQTETEANAWLEIMNSTDPSFSVEGVGAEDEWKARGIERTIDLILRANKWTYLQNNTYRVVSYQGMRVLKPGWREIKYAPMRRPSKEELVAWDEALNQAMKDGTVTSPPDPKSRPEEFQAWMDATQSIVPGFPDAPAPHPVETIKYRGPWFTPVSNFELVYDPFVEHWQDHEILFQRVVKPHAWGEQQVEAGKFDAEQFKKAGRAGVEDRRLSKWDTEISSQIGIVQDENDPRWKNSDEYLEVWRPFDTTAPHIIILNRSAIVNTSTAHPYWHRQLPYVCIKNNPQPGYAVGIGSYAQLRRTFHDRLTFRDLMLDGLLLSVMPVFLKSRNMGMTEMQRFLQPGMILETNDPNGLKRGWESMAGFSELLRVGQELMNDQNVMLSTGENVRGQTSTVGRVSATESQQRLTQALTRHKQKATRIEEEESALLPQALELIYQYMPEDDPQLMAIRAAMVGEDEMDPLRAPEFSRETFAEALTQNVRFRGATSKINKELAAQQIKDFLAMASQIQSAAGIPVAILTPQETRSLVRRGWDALGQKGGTTIFTAAGDEAIAQATQAHLITAQTAPSAAQLQGLQIQAQAQQLMAPSVPVDANGQPVSQEGQAPQEQQTQEDQSVQAQA